jgi:hypothetical protein
LARQRGVPNLRAREDLTEEQILAWADAHHRRTGQWPIKPSGAVHGTRLETWTGIDKALRRGDRGLAAGSSLARLLARHRGLRNAKDLPVLSEHAILVCADAYHRRTGRWPSKASRSIRDGIGTGALPKPGEPRCGETWQAVDEALRYGRRGLPRGSSLAQLLARHRGTRNIGRLPGLTEKQVLAWADAHHRRTGQWPTRNSGPIAGTHGETWQSIHDALRGGRRGFAGDSSLPRLLARRRGVRNKAALPALTEQQILAWADEHFRRTGKWPNVWSGPIPGALGTTWRAVHMALYAGGRGLPGGSSLHRLLDRVR